MAEDSDDRYYPTAHKFEKLIRIGIADDHTSTRKGLESGLASCPFFSLVFQAANGRELLELLKNHEIDLLILDYSMPEINGLDAMVEIAPLYPKVKVVFYTFIADQFRIKDLRELGIDALIQKNTGFDELIDALLAVHAQPKVRRKNTFTEGDIVMRLSGEMKKMKNGNQVLWELKSMKTPVLTEGFDISSGLSVQQTYNSKLELQQNDIGNIYRQNYNFNTETGNLTNRATQNFQYAYTNNESFEFDNFDRLKKVKTTVGNNSITKQTLSYNENGNISTKDDCGNYLYSNPNQPYTLTQIQNQQSNISLNTLTFAYNDFDKVTQIAEATTNKQFDFFYGNNFNRIQMNYKVNGQTQYARYYGDMYEREESGLTVREWAYVSSPTGITGVFYTKNGLTEYFDISSDQNGSPILLTTAGGQIAEEQSFDAWGRRRNPGTWAFTNIPTPQIMIRGYGFHEHLDELGLINMNGRLYEPVLGRFIQVDPIVQEPDNPQNYNRYSYVGNNPVNYSDPSGYTRIGAGAGMGAESNVGRQSNPWAGPPTLFVDGMRVEANSGDYSFWLGGRGLGGMNRDKLVGKVDYGGNLSSVGIRSGMSVGPNGQLYSVLAANKISTGLTNGTLSYNSMVGAYGHTEYSNSAEVSLANNYHIISSSSNVINEEGLTTGETTYFVTDVGADGWGQGGGEYDINKAVNYLNDHAYPVYDKATCGYCARAVGNALQAGGINTAGRPGSAKNYGPFLKEKGFSSMGATNYTPIKGDIRVFQPYPTGNQNGHINMYNGNQWISDYRENGFWPGPGYRQYKPAFEIYRWGTYP